jgi:hypothetical protein
LGPEGLWHDNNHLYLSIVHVVFQAREVPRHGNNYGRHQVIRHQHPQQVPYAPQQQQPPQLQQQQPHVHFAPQQQPPPQQQQQQPQQRPQQQPQQQQQQQPQQPQPQQQVPFALQPPLVPNGLYAADIMRQACATSRAQQQNQNNGGSNGP